MTKDCGVDIEADANAIEAFEEILSFDPAHSGPAPRAWHNVLQDIVDKIPVSIAIFNDSGELVIRNAAWSKTCGVQDTRVGKLSKTVKGLHDVIAGTRRSCSVNFAAQGVRKAQRVRMRATRILSERRYVMITHEDVSAAKQVKADLRQLSSRLLKAQDDERRRIARELHDTTVQDLVAAKLCVEKVNNSIERSNDRNSGLSDAIKLLENSLRDLRTLSYLLHPPMLDELGLVPAVRWYLRGFQERTGIHITFEASPRIPRVLADIESALFRVVQETLTNVYRHSGSKIAIVSLSRARKKIVLEVTDAGRGMPADTSRGKCETVLGVGIPGMRARAERFDGHLTIHSNKRGTKLRATFPIP